MCVPPKQRTSKNSGKFANCMCLELPPASLKRPQVPRAVRAKLHKLIMCVCVEVVVHV